MFAFSTLRNGAANQSTSFHNTMYANVFPLMGVDLSLARIASNNPLSSL